MDVNLIVFLSVKFFDWSQLSWKLSDRPVGANEQEEHKSLEYRSQQKCVIFLAYTSNMISSGIRETINFLVRNSLVGQLNCTVLR